MVLPRRCPLSFVEVSRPSHGSTILSIFKPKNSQNGPLPAFLRGGEQAQPREYYFEHFQAQKLPKWYSHACPLSFAEVSRPIHGSTILSIFRGEQAQQREYYFKHFQAPGLPKWYSHAAARFPSWR